MRHAAIAALFSLIALALIAPIAQAQSAVLRCASPAGAAGEGFELVVHEDLGAELRLSREGGSAPVICALRLTDKRYCPECHVPLLDINFTPRGGCLGADAASAGLRNRITLHARLRRHAVAEPYLVYQSSSEVRPCTLVEFQPEGLGLPKDLRVSQ